MSIMAPVKPDDSDETGRAPSRVAVAVPDFDTVYREHRHRVLGAVRRVIGPDLEIEDVMQLVFLEVHRCLPRFEGRSKLSTWVHRIAVNVALQHLRRKKRRRWLRLGLTGDERPPQESPDAGVRRLEGRELLARVYRIIDRLTEKKRAVWVLHELEGLSPAEIGAVLDIPTNTVRSRLVAARREMLAALAQEEAS